MQHSVPYTPQQNGVAERKNMALKEMETCMIEAKDLIPKLWDEAINYDAYIQNISLHKSMDGKTPYEAWFGHKTNISHFGILGSRDSDRIPPEKRKALQQKRNECIMFGYYEYTKGYNLFYPSTQNTFNLKKRPFQISN